MSEKIKQLAPLIWAEIERAKNILINLHYNPDQDSVGSALALKSALAARGKTVTVFSSESPVPEFARYLPGGQNILVKKFADLDIALFDLFLIPDTAQSSMITPK